jgi:hypothetical protein
MSSLGANMQQVRACMGATPSRFGVGSHSHVRQGHAATLLWPAANMFECCSAASWYSLILLFLSLLQPPFTHLCHSHHATIVLPSGFQFPLW